MWNRGLCPQRPNVKVRSHIKRVAPSYSEASVMDGMLSRVRLFGTPAKGGFRNYDVLSNSNLPITLVFIENKS
jgi:hypothetical protein